MKILRFKIALAVPLYDLRDEKAPVCKIWCFYHNPNTLVDFCTLVPLLCPPDTAFDIQALAVWGYGDSPQYWYFTSERGMNILLLWNLKARVGLEPTISDFPSRQPLHQGPRRSLGNSVQFCDAINTYILESNIFFEVYSIAYPDDIARLWHFLIYLF